MKKLGLLLMLVGMGVSSLLAVTYPSESYSLSAPSISYAPAVDSPCAGATRDERESCCGPLLLSCVESCGEDADCRTDCEDSYEACMETGEQSLPLNGGEWVLLVLLAAYAAYQYRKLESRRLNKV